MAVKAQALLLLAVVVSCQCKPFNWGFGFKNKGNITASKKVEAGAEIGMENWKPGLKGNIHGQGDLDVENKFTGMAYVAKKKADGTGMTGIGVYHHADTQAGVGVSGDANINTGGGKGKNLLSVTGGKAESAGIGHREIFSVTGDTHMMSSNELTFLANMYGSNVQTRPIVEKASATTERFFSG